MAIDNSRGQSLSDFDPSQPHPEDVGFAPDDQAASTPLFNPSPCFPDELDDALIPGSAFRTFASSVNRIAGGCQVIVDLLAQEASDDARRLPGDPTAPPLILGPFHRGQMYLMLSASMEGLAREAERLVEFAAGHFHAKVPSGLSDGRGPHDRCRERG